MIPDEAFYDKKMKCLYCGSPFVTRRVRSRFSVPYKVDSDFCPHYRDGNYNPHFYFVNVCPECGFAFSEEFSEQFPLGTRDAIQLRITKKWTKRDFGQIRDFKQAAEAYMLSILAGSLKKEKNSVMAGLSLRLAWLYRGEDIVDQEKRFLSLALKSYEESFLYSDFTGTSMSELKVLFMVGELSRRLGQHDKAVLYFSKIIQHKEANAEPKIVNLARKQWQETTEDKRRKRDLGI